MPDDGTYDLDAVLREAHGGKHVATREHRNQGSVIYAARPDYPDERRWDLLDRYTPKHSTAW